MSSSLIGRKLGKYEIVELVGQGGMATVYKGYQGDIDRYVAVKVLPPHPGLDQHFIERFRLEARTVARLQHPHILPLYDYGVQDDILYLVTAYVEGGSLNERIHRGKMPPGEAARLLRQMASALDFAHRQGIIHRDIKPDNVLVDREGHVLLADFGIAKLAEGEARLTVTGGLVGTPAYMSPEQGRGETVTGSADIYSLGVVVYEMLTGKQPFTASTPMQVVLKHMTEPVPSVRAESAGLPPSLEPVMQRVLAKDPESRYRTAMAFAEDFERAIQGAVDTKPAVAEGVPTTTPGALPPINPNLTPPPTTVIVQERGYSPLVLLGGFGIIALLVVVVVVLVLNSQRDAPPSLPPPPTDAVRVTQAAVVPPPPAQTFGRASYTTTDSLGDTLTLTVQNVKPPAAGRVYAAWLKNTVTGDTMLLGELAVDALGSGALAPYIDPDGRPLFALYNAIAITDEPRMAETPTGAVVYSASVPPELMDALTEILLRSEDGFAAGAAVSSYGGGGQDSGGQDSGAKGSLLDGALIEAQTAAQHAGFAAGSNNIGGMHTHTEHTINILNGTTVDYNRSGRGENPGRGVGVVRFLDLIEAQLDAVADAPAASRSLQSDLEFIRACTQNVRQWIGEITALDEAVLAASDVAEVADEAARAVELAETIIGGVDLNGSGQVEPFEGECGLEQIRTFGALVSTLNLTEGNVLE
ncbi:MAG: hypothetical protein BroJett038_27380 [Chloroflexota bacterium]|nr:MAG: hypothetical protein BroJett038_27380 [Chloroflexota bacterium]